MRLFPMLKRNSKLALKGSWGGAILLFLLVIGVSMLVAVTRYILLTVFEGGQAWEFAGSLGDSSAAAAVAGSFYFSVAEWIILVSTSVVMVLLLAPLELGMARWFFGVVKGEKNGISEAFFYFETGKGFARSIWYHINMYVRSMLWAILFYTVPGVILGVSVYFLGGGAELNRMTSTAAGAGLFLSAALFILATIFFAACVNRYALAAYLMADDNALSVRQAIRRSVAYTKGYRFSILWFSLSFFGWILLSVIFFPVIFYVVPYYSTAMAMYGRYIIEKNRFDTAEATQDTDGGENDTYDGGSLASEGGGGADYIGESGHSNGDVSIESGAPKDATDEWEPEQ